MSILSDIVAEVITLEHKLLAAFEASPVGKMIEDDFKAAVKELESVAAHDLANVVKTIGVAILEGLATSGGNTTAAIAAGIAAAGPAFKAAEADISQKTVTTLVGTVVNQLAVVAPVTK
jgi:hypothetical protein